MILLVVHVLGAAAATAVVVVVAVDVRSRVLPHHRHHDQLLDGAVDQSNGTEPGIHLVLLGIVEG
jgi:hypothetical protein